MKKLLACLFILCSFSLWAQQRKIDSLQVLLKTDKEDTNKVKHLGALAELNYNQSDLKKALEYSDIAAEISRKTNYVSGLISSYTMIGAVYYIQANYDLSLDYFSKLIKLANERRIHPETIRVAFGDISMIYDVQGDFPKALEYSLKALALNEKAKDTDGIAANFQNISEIYYHQSNYSQSLGYLQKALKLDEARNHKQDEGSDWNSIGSIYVNENKLEEAMDCYKKCLNLFKDTASIATVLGNIGSLYQVEKQFPKALQYYTQSMNMEEKMGKENNVAMNLYNIANIYLSEKQYSNAEKYLLQSLKIADTLHYYEIINDGYATLSELYEKTNQWEKALKAFKKSDAAYDSAFNQNKSKEVGRLEAKYQYDKDSVIQQANFTNQLGIEQAETAKKTAESKTEKVIIGLIASLAGMLILLVIIVFQRMKNIEKKKLIAEQQKAWLELKALRTQMNPHFLYNTLNSIQNFVVKNDSKASSRYLSQFAGLMRNVLENSRKDKITLAEEIEGLNNYIDFEMMRFPQKFNYNIKVDLSLDKDKTQLPPLLIQPYVENAIWHGLMHLEERTGQLSIFFEKVGYQLKCTVDDNGIGRQAAAALKKQSVHKSLGLSIVAERMESMNKMYNWDMKTEIIDKVNENGTSAGTKAALFLPLIINAVAYA